MWGFEGFAKTAYGSHTVAEMYNRTENSVCFSENVGHLHEFMAHPVWVPLTTFHKAHTALPLSLFPSFFSFSTLRPQARPTTHCVSEWPSLACLMKAASTGYGGCVRFPGHYNHPPPPHMVWGSEGTVNFPPFLLLQGMKGLSNPPASWPPKLHGVFRGCEKLCCSVGILSISPDALKPALLGHDDVCFEVFV